MNQKGFQQKKSAFLLLSVLTTLALLAFAAAPVMGQDATPKFRGNFGAGFGQKAIESKDLIPDAPGQANEDIKGLITSIEANLFAEGGNGAMSYQIRLRFRGIENQNDLGDSNLFAGNNVQTMRGYVRWHVTETFDVTIGKYGGTRQTSGTENDPVQNFPYPLYTADLADAGMIDLTFKFAGGIAGVMISPDTAGNMTTSGVARFGGLGGGRTDVGNNNMTINPYYNGKFGGFGFGARVAISSGETRKLNTGDKVSLFDIVTLLGNLDDSKNQKRSVTLLSDLDGQSFDSLGFGIGVKIPLGGAGSLKVDFESSTSDLYNDPVAGLVTEDSKGAPVSEEEMTGFGALLQIMGINVGIATATQKVGGDEFERQNISVHYRIPTGKGSWVAPEYQSQTKSISTASPPPANTVADEEQTTLRFLMNIGF